MCSIWPLIFVIFPSSSSQKESYLRLVVLLGEEDPSRGCDASLMIVSQGLVLLADDVDWFLRTIVSSRANIVAVLWRNSLRSQVQIRISLVLYILGTHYYVSSIIGYTGLIDALILSYIFRCIVF